MLSVQRHPHFPPRRRRILLTALIGVLALFAAACGDSDSGDSSSSDSDGSGGLSGSIFITGSSTVEPVTNLLAESFAAANPSVAFSVQGPGSGDGHKAACAGEVPIWNSSRQIKDSEAECLAEAGIDFIELRVGIDGISVITSAENDAIDCLDFEDLYSLIGIESTGIGSWADANDLNVALGGEGSFPDADLEIFAPGEESGTFDSFVEIALEGVWEARVESGDADENFAVRPDYNASADDNVIIDGVAGNGTSLGWVGFAFADQNRERVRLVEIDGGDGCTAPTPETIASAAFPISRFLYTYIDAGHADDPAVKAFVDYMLSDEGQAFVIEAGYVNLDPADLEQGRSNWSNRTTGRTF